MISFCKILAGIVIAIALLAATLFLFAFLSVFGSSSEGAMASAAANAGGFGGAIVMALLAMIVYLLASSQTLFPTPKQTQPNAPGWADTWSKEERASHSKSASDYGM
jgi:hypothetical protein